MNIARRIRIAGVIVAAACLLTVITGCTQQTQNCTPQAQDETSIYTPPRIPAPAPRPAPVVPRPVAPRPAPAPKPVAPKVTTPKPAPKAPKVTTPAKPKPAKPAPAKPTKPKNTTPKPAPAPHTEHHTTVVHQWGIYPTWWPMWWPIWLGGYGNQAPAAPVCSAR
ncbi:hypothetical protein [Pseudolysinimonas sp.]|uniref:hypothetical protein n=1 Tax=Pseudolysinimonas sp. TaxID=2680009 RepID=UPI003F804FD5